MIQTNSNANTREFALFELGFRTFFLCAATFSLASMLVWMLAYGFSWQVLPAETIAMTWHAHEMVFGYAMAVVAGFLLTAAGNWTGRVTARGPVLAAIAALWLLARLAWFWPASISMQVAALCDSLFLLWLIFVLTKPLVQARQWKQFGLVSKLWLLLGANAVFYLGLAGMLEQGERWGIYSGLYLILALIFVLVRRVLPFFIERGVDENFSSRNALWVDLASMVLMVVWAVLDIFTGQRTLVAWLSLSLFLLHALRLYRWHTPGIWQKPLLWSFYLGYAFLALGFLLHGLTAWLGLSPYLALHAFAVGGVGVITISMMSRVSLGHTGRSIHQPPGVLKFVFALMLLGTVLRVLFPLISTEYYATWVLLSQCAWVAAYGVFLWTYVPIFITPRVDGRPG